MSWSAPPVGLFTVTAAEEGTLLLDTATGKAWVLHTMVNQEMMWLAVGKRIDDADKALDIRKSEERLREVLGTRRRGAAQAEGQELNRIERRLCEPEKEPAVTEDALHAYMFRNDIGSGGEKVLPYDPNLGKTPGPYAVIAGDEGMVLLEPKTGASWMLHQSAAGIPMWLAVKRVDDINAVGVYLRANNEQAAKLQAEGDRTYLRHVLDDTPPAGAVAQ